MIREIVVEPQAVAWLPWAVSYFFFIGIAFTSVMIAFYMRFLSKNHNVLHELIVVTIALSCVIVAPIALVADLHQPARAYNFYFSMAPWSWMAWGSFFVPIFAVSVVGYFFFLMRQVATAESFPKWLRFLFLGKFNNVLWTKLFSLASLGSASLVLLYTVMEVYIVTARPLWNEIALAPLFFFSILPTAALLIALILRVVFKTQVSKWLNTVALVSVVILALTMFWYTQTSTENAFAIIALWNNSYALLFTVTSLVLLGVTLVIPNNSIMMMTLRAVLAMGVGVLVRWMVLMEAQFIPKYNILLNPYDLLWSSDGILGMVGMIGLWLVVGVILWQLLSYALQPKIEGRHYG